MARHDFQLNVRVAHELVDWLKQEATKNRRSFTAQLNKILEDFKKQEEQREQETKAV